MHRPSLREKKSKQDTNVIINHLPAVSAEAFKDLPAGPHITVTRWMVFCYRHQLCQDENVQKDSETKKC